MIAVALSLAGCSQGTPTGTPAKPTEPAAVDAAAAAPAPAAPDLASTLVAYRWKLDAATDAGGQSIGVLFPGPENLLGLEFADGRMGVTGGCNRIVAGYQVLDAGRLQLSPGASTMMACLPPLAEADAAIGRLLTGTLQAELQGDAGAPLLRLAAADGSVLSFSGTPTPETRYGVPGARAFLEVSTEPCPAPAEPSCLMVRDRSFDEQGLPSGTPGDLRALPAGIDGYAPTPGQQQVVRVKRFDVAAGSGREASTHYVFDMVVETRTIP